MDTSRERSRSTSASEDKEKKSKHPRLYHKKSRNGCQRCRARRVKCDETRPTCGDCSRHRVSCLYDRSPHSSRSPSAQPRVLTPAPPQELPAIVKGYRTPFPIRGSPEAFNRLSITSYPSDDNFMLPESAERRRVELRLLENYITSTSHTFPGCNNPAVLESWSIEVPQLALQHDNLLYPMFSISALHLLKSEPQNQDLQAARQSYMTLSLQEHRRAVAVLNERSAETVILASTLILMDAFASLQLRNLKPYTPPSLWLQMSRGGCSVYSAAKRFFSDRFIAKFTAITMVNPGMQEAHSLDDDKNREAYQGLLRQDLKTDEVWDDETKECYEKTLNYIGSVQIAIQNGEHAMAITQRIMAFAVLAPKKFIEAVEQKRPRALVVLAHFFSLGQGLEDIWWFGDAAQREIRAIWNELLPGWQGLVSPLLG